MTRFIGKVALVTGGRSGIGQAIARRLTVEGAIVYTAQRGDDPEHPSILADFTDPASVAQIIPSLTQQTGQLDILINNAGMMQEATVEAMTLTDWDKTLAVNLTAPFLLIKHALPHLRKSKGRIVNIGSIEGLGSNPTHAAYCASKAGLHALTRAIAVDHGPDGIRCNAIAPGWIDTDLNTAYVENMPDPVAFKENLAHIHPIGRTGTPADVAALATFLASDDSAFITGEIYKIDGGRMSKLSLP